MTTSFWKNRRVFITGHTGFKGTWLSLWLSKLGAKVHGYALAPPTKPSLFELTSTNELLTETISDITDSAALSKALFSFSPEIVFHMAAQPLVRDSYEFPVKTYTTNVMGTVAVLEAIRDCKTVKVLVNVTTDKCYLNREWPWGYRENEALGGYDPYSSSKACSEIVTSAYRDSFFRTHAGDLTMGIATARAGNVVGGGDFAKDRLVPDCIRSILSATPISVRYPKAIRPWQHVLEPLSGYMLLAEKIYENPVAYSGPYNFGPEDYDAKPVEWIVERFCTKWPGASYVVDKTLHHHEAHYLKLDISKSRTELGFRPRWSIDRAIDSIVQWTQAFRKNENLREICLSQIAEYEAS